VLTLTQESPSSDPEERSRTFAGETISIGRIEGNDLILPMSHISSRHAVIRYRGGAYFLADLGSTNGSMVVRGEERLMLGPKGRPEVALLGGDLLVLGDIDDPVQLRVTLDEAAESVASPAGQNTIVASRARGETLAISQRITSDHDALQAIFRLVERINRAGENEQILGRVVEAALEAIPGAMDALVVLSGVDGLTVTAEAHRGRGLCREPNVKICEQVIGGDTALLFGQHEASALPAHTLVSQGVGSGIAAPLWGDQRANPRGVLQVNCEPDKAVLKEDHLDLAVVLAHHAAVALERAELVARLRDAERRLREENTLLRQRTQPVTQMVAESPAMERVAEELRRVAASDVTVLLQGETGTGKEVAARVIHESSPRRDGLLVPVNCGALTESLLDSELFGHRKGAFTGATSDRKGVFEVAEGGTVFLDEIGETPPSVQVRLLRVLEENKIKVVGDSVERRVDVRIVVATNRDLTRRVKEGRFREDLYFRLRVFPVTLPPLRERPQDIEPLCQLFVERYSIQLGRRVGGVDPSLISALRGYSFPGNVRELANEIERAVVRAEEGTPLTAELLTEELLSAAEPIGGDAAPGARTLRQQLAEVERKLIREALERHGGSKSAAARELGVTRQGLTKKMERLGL
jgi:Nif-specific regulatory protein